MSAMSGRHETSQLRLRLFLTKSSRLVPGRTGLRIALGVAHGDRGNVAAVQPGGNRYLIVHVRSSMTASLPQKREWRRRDTERR
jgi:hypothetical protein